VRTDASLVAVSRLSTTPRCVLLRWLDGINTSWESGGQNVRVGEGYVNTKVTEGQSVRTTEVRVEVSAMTDDSKPSYFELDLGSAEDIEEVVIAFRKDGELYELASVEPPVEARIERLQQQDQESRASRCR
jgi:hypothetical protein